MTTDPRDLHEPAVDRAAPTLRPPSARPTVRVPSATTRVRDATLEASGALAMPLAAIGWGALALLSLVSPRFDHFHGHEVFRVLSILAEPAWGALALAIGVTQVVAVARGPRSARLLYWSWLAAAAFWSFVTVGLALADPTRLMLPMYFAAAFGSSVRVLATGARVVRR